MTDTDAPQPGDRVRITRSFPPRLVPGSAPTEYLREGLVSRYTPADEYSSLATIELGGDVWAVGSSRDGVVTAVEIVERAR